MSTTDHYVVLRLHVSDGFSRLGHEVGSCDLYGYFYYTLGIETTKNPQ